MLLFSPGDDSASLPIDSLNDQPDVISACQSDMECYQTTPTDATSKPIAKAVGLKAIEGDRKEALVHISTTFVAKGGDRPPLQPPTVTPSSHRHSRDTDPPETALDGLYALRQAAKLRTSRQLRASSYRIAFALLPETDGGKTIDSYAAPLAPLRERDVTALAALFQRDDMPSIAADVSHRLLSLLPEPCWEEDAFAFLREFT